MSLPWSVTNQLPGARSASPGGRTDSRAEPPRAERLRAVRDQIDDLDRALVELLAGRQALVSRIRDLKPPDGPVRVREREREVLDHVLRVAQDTECDPVLVRDVYVAVLDAFVRWQERTRTHPNPLC